LFGESRYEAKKLKRPGSDDYGETP